MTELSLVVSELCDVCRAIDFAAYFQPPVEGEPATKNGIGGLHYKPRELGLRADLEEKKASCAFCHLVYTATDLLPGRERATITISSVLCGTSRTIDGVELTSAYYMHVLISLNESRTSAYIQLLADSAHQLGLPSDFLARVPSHDTFDMRQALEWIEKCKVEHGSLCDTLEGDADGAISTPQPVNLLAIDLLNMCICNMPEGSEYAALSYCWPKEVYLTLLKENRAALFEFEALVEKMSNLPGTIQDAINSTKELKIRYLWIDALCIVQDDVDQKGDQLRQMDRVYNCASLTLVCAYPVPRNTDDPCSGLPGYRKPDARRMREVHNVKGLRLMVASPDIDECIQRTRWYTRCWTFQEGLLSRRLLYFTPRQVYFQCSCNVFCEDTVGETLSSSAHVSPGNTVWNTKSRNPANAETGSWGAWALSRKPLRSLTAMLLSYEYSLSAYTYRDVSYASDMLKAFDGIKAVMSDAMQTDFWQGIPEKILPQALCWQLRGSYRRRRCRPADGPPSKPLFASWAWAGWESSVNLNDYMFVKMYRTEAEFYIVNDNAVATRLDVKPEWESMQNQRAHPSVIRAFLPEIVPRHTVDASSKEWRNARTLGIWTTSASFLLDGTHHVLSTDSNHEKLWRDSINFAIKDQYGDTAGSILLPNTYFEDFSDDWVEREFILISRCVPLESQIQNSHFDEKLYHKKKAWCCLNIMMISRTGEYTALRAGMGILHKEAWVKAKPMTVFVKLL